MAKQNVGRDLSLVFTAGGNTLAEFGLTTDVNIKPQFHEVRTKPINAGGVPVARSLYQGYEIDITFSRVNGTADALLQFIEENYEAGNTDINVSMQITVRNSDSSLDVFIFTDGIVYFTDAGNFKSVDDVPYSLKTFFRRRQFLSNNSAPTAGGQGIVDPTR